MSSETSSTSNCPQPGDRVTLRTRTWARSNRSKPYRNSSLPSTGEVIAVNDDARESRALNSFNESPYDKGWLIRVKPDDPSELDSTARRPRLRLAHRVRSVATYNRPTSIPRSAGGLIPMPESVFTSPFIPNTDDDRKPPCWPQIGVRPPCRGSLRPTSPSSSATLRSIYRTAGAGDAPPRRDGRRWLSATSTAGDHPSFLGAGVYHHFCPRRRRLHWSPAASSSPPTRPTSRRFPRERSKQHTSSRRSPLELFGMEVSNAGMYDGAIEPRGGRAHGLPSQEALPRRRPRHRQPPLRRNDPGFYVQPQNIEVYETCRRIAPNLRTGHGLPHHSVPQLLRSASKTRRRSSHSLRTPHGALFVTSCDPTALAMFKPARRVRRRYRHRRGAGARRASQFRRPLRRHLHLPPGVHPAAPRAHRRQDHGHRGPHRLRSDPPAP